VSGLGATAADGIFAAIIGFGLAAIRHWFEGWSETLQIAGGVLLIGFGIHTYFADPMHGREFQYEGGHHHKGGNHAFLRSFASTFAIAMSNPATLFAFAALFAGFGGIVASEHASWTEAGFVVAGVMVGSGLWWLTLTSVVGLLHARIDARIMRIITHVSGIVVTLFGLVMLARVVWVRWI
jgi:threonine/homoserine/homoserine lactone efflux protein